MAVLEFLVLVLALVDGSGAAWCVCISSLNTSALQKTLDYACGDGADCNPILQNGACYNPNTVDNHCSYAANSYYQRQNQTQGACDFSGTAMLTSTDPSSGSGCTYPATPSAAGSSGTPATNSSGSGSGGSGSGSGSGGSGSGSATSPGSTLTPNTGTGVIGGLGPSGTASYDGSAAGFPLKAEMSSLLLTMLLPILLCLGID